MMCLLSSAEVDTTRQQQQRRRRLRKDRKALLCGVVRCWAKQTGSASLAQLERVAGRAVRPGSCSPASWGQRWRQRKFFSSFFVGGAELSRCQHLGRKDTLCFLCRFFFVAALTDFFLILFLNAEITFFAADFCLNEGKMTISIVESV